MISDMGKYSANKLPSDILKLVATNVADLRKEKKWTQPELSERSGVPFGTIKLFERSGKISFLSLLKLVEALGRLSDFENILERKDNERIRNLFKSS